MKILIAVPDTAVGGVTASAVNFSNELASRGNKVYFLDMSGENACRDRLNTAVELLSLGGKSRLWNIGVSSLKKARGAEKLGLLTLGLIKKLTIRSGLWFRIVFSKFNESESYDVAVAFRQCAPCYSFVLNKVAARKKIGFVHGELAYMGNISSWKKYMTRFDKIAYVSNAVREQFVAAYPELKDNACTIYNMFDVARIKALAEEPCDIVFDKSKVNIVTVARITKQKQIDWILNVCNKLKENCPVSFHWYIVGDGYYREEMENYSRFLNINDVVTFVGDVDNPYPLIKKASFTVLSSAREAYGMVVVESFILETPIVVAKYSALKEIMQDGEYGIIAQQDLDDLYSKLIQMVENHQDIRTKCKSRLSLFEFSNDQAYAQFIAAIE